MAQLQVGDKVKVNGITGVKSGVITVVQSNGMYQVLCDGATVGCSDNTLELLPSTLTIAATLTTDTIPTELLKQLSAAGFLITIQNQPK